MDMFFYVYIIIFLIAFLMSFIVKIKIEKTFKKIYIGEDNINDIIEYIDINETELFYCNTISNILIISIFPLVNIISIFKNFSVFNQKKYNNAINIISNKIILQQLSKLKEYDKDYNFYKNLYSLIKENTINSKAIISISLNSLIKYIKQFEKIHCICDEDIKYKENIKNKLNTSILEFKQMAKELSILANEKDNSFNNLDEFNLLLSKITNDIKLNKAIFIK